MAGAKVIVQAERREIVQAERRVIVQAERRGIVQEERKRQSYETRRHSCSDSGFSAHPRETTVAAIASEDPRKQYCWDPAQEREWAGVGVEFLMWMWLGEGKSVRWREELSGSI